MFTGPNSCNSLSSFIGQGPFPGVLDLLGNIGGVVEDRAAQLASRGVATLALGYVHKIHEGGQTTDLEYFEVHPGADNRKKENHIVIFICE